MTRARDRSPFLVAALEYAGDGIGVFPCGIGKKKPILKDRAGYLDATTDEAQLLVWWGRWPNANIGIVPGPKYVVLDLDGPEAEATAKELGFAESDTRQVKTARGRHLYFVHPGGTIGNRKIGSKIDVRADKGYVMAPPSVHPDGPVYTWTGGALIHPLPDTVRRLLDERSLATPLGEGGRNVALASELGRLRQAGATFEELMEAAATFNADFDPPLEDDEVRSVVKSIFRYRPGLEPADEVLREFNAKYAFIQVGNKVRVLQERVNGYDLWPVPEFKSWHSNRQVLAAGKPQNAADFWARNPLRRTYEGLVFVPGGTAPPGFYNVWLGWGVEPSIEGSCDLFLSHLRENICSGHVPLFEWVLGWVAQIFQDPRHKVGTALALRGAQGTGKSIVGNVIGRLLGNAYRQVATERMVTGQFNQHFEGALLVHADEAFWAGDKGSEGVLKDLVTSDTMWIERKGLDPVQMANHVRLFITSNADWVVPAGMEERRFATIQVGAERTQDNVYFDRMMAELDAGGYGRLLDHLLKLDLTTLDLRTIPHTAALNEQKLASLSPEEAWWVEVLQRGLLPSDAAGTGRVATSALFDDYYAHAQRIGLRRRQIGTIVGIFLKKIAPGLEHCRVETKDGNLVAGYQLPPLAECRRAFSRAMRGFDGWVGPETWERDDTAIGTPHDAY